MASATIKEAPPQFPYFTEEHGRLRQEYGNSAKKRLRRSPKRGIGGGLSEIMKEILAKEMGIP
jgi:hypothetical protein